MPISPPLDSPAPRRLPVAASGGRARRRASNMGRHFPADPPRTEEIIAAMRCRDDTEHGARARALIAVLWRAGLRIQGALDLTEVDLDRRRGSILVRRSNGGRRRSMPVGLLFCVINGPTRGRPLAARPSARDAPSSRRPGRRAPPVRAAPTPPPPRHRARPEGVPLVIQRQLGHRNLGVTLIDLQGVDPDEIIQTVHAPPAAHDRGQRRPLPPAGSDWPAKRSSSTVAPFSIPIELPLLRD